MVIRKTTYRCWLAILACMIGSTAYCAAGWQPAPADGERVLGLTGTEIHGSENLTRRMILLGNMGIAALVLVQFGSSWLNRCRTTQTADDKTNHFAMTAGQESAILNGAFDGVLMIDHRGRILWTNPATERLFGLSTAQAVGKRISEFVDFAQPADATCSDPDVRFAAELSKFVGKRLEVTGRGAAGSRIRVELSITALVEGYAPVFAAFVRDLTQTRLAESQFFLQLQIARILAANPCQKEAMANILAVICQSIRWDVGAFWQLDARQQQVRCLEVYSDSDSPCDEFVQVTQGLWFDYGEGLPGKVWLREDLLWIDDLSAESSFLRSQQSEACGLRSGVAFPVRFAGQILGVFEFFRREVCFPQAELVALFESVAAQVGQFLERKNAEDRLRASEERYRSLALATTQIVWCTDADGYVVDPHPSWQEYTGQSAEEVMGMGWSAALHPDDVSAVLHDWNCSLQNRTVYNGQFRARRADGEYRMLTVRGVPVLNPDGQVREWVGTCIDIEDQQQAAAAVVQRERQLRAVFESALDGMVVTDKVHGCVDANPAACVLFGLTRHELLGRRLSSFFTPSEHATGFWSDFERQGCSSGELRLLRPDGATRDVELQAKANLLPGQNLWVLHDITERKRLEEKLRHSQKMEAIGQLAGGIAHDFNNLLTVILGFCEIVRDTLSPSDPARTSLLEVEKAGKRAANLTRQLLAFSRRQVLSPELIDLSSLVQDMEKMLCRLIGEDIELVAELATDLGYVKADPGQLEQVILNLAVNARDAMPLGGQLKISTVNATLAAPGPSRTGNSPEMRPYVVLTVTDTGCGMPAEVRAKVFEPFFTTKAPGQGTGLGLATVYGILEQSGGYITVDSVPEVGSTFKVFLPMVAEHSAEEHVPTNDVSLTRGTGTILLVEDEIGVRRLSRRLLEGQGYHVLEASDGREALRIGEGFGGPIHLLLTDVVMPGLGGRALAEQLSRIRPEMAVLYMSGYTDDSIVRHGIFAAETQLLPKPFTPDALARKVHEALDRTASLATETVC